MKFNSNYQKWILDSLINQKIFEPTPIQLKTMPLIAKRENIIGVAPTGTGKTLAFVLPILNNLDLSQKLQVIIITPTRELARQIFSKIIVFKKHQPLLQVKMLIGGESIDQQINSQLNKSQLLIATPTRLKQILTRQILDLHHVNALVFDEADMLMDLGFISDLEFINSQFTNKDVQKISFSATLHEMLSIQLKKYFKNTKIINISNSIYENKKITHYVIHNHDKWHSLSIIMNTIKPYLCIIFANTKKEVEAIYQYLIQQNKNVCILHGSLLQRERKNNYRDIKNNKFQYVVASDIASRGLDIDGVSHIINWNLPTENEWYIHRAGRSGRGKYSGESYVLYDQKEHDKLLNLSKKGIVFHHKFIKENELFDKEFLFKKKNQFKDLKTQNEIQKIISTTSTKIKPGYKKKIKEAIQKINQKNKRSHIEKKMNAHRIRGYKLKNS